MIVQQRFHFVNVDDLIIDFHKQLEIESGLPFIRKNPNEINAESRFLFDWKKDESSRLTVRVTVGLGQLDPYYSTGKDALQCIIIGRGYKDRLWKMKPVYGSAAKRIDIAAAAHRARVAQLVTREPWVCPIHVSYKLMNLFYLESMGCIAWRCIADHCFRSQPLSLPVNRALLLHSDAQFLTSRTINRKKLNPAS